LTRPASFHQVAAKATQALERDAGTTAAPSAHALSPEQDALVEVRRRRNVPFPITHSAQPNGE
jgi:hypothetical protein